MAIRCQGCTTWEPRKDWGVRSDRDGDKHPLWGVCPDHRRHSWPSWLSSMPALMPGVTNYMDSCDNTVREDRPS